MSRELTRRRLLAGGASAAVASVAGCTGMTPFVGRRNERTETLAVDGAETLSVYGSNGSIDIRSADREDVHIEILEQASSVTAGLDDVTLRIERPGDAIELHTETEGGSSLFGGEPSISLDITIPESLAVDRIETSVGSVTITDVSGDVDVTGSTASVDVDGVDGNVSADTSTGSVTIRNVDRIGDVTTSTGSIDVDVPAIDGDTRITASTGSITARIGKGVDAELRVSTSTGSTTVSGLDLETETFNDTIVGTLGDGGPTLRIETSTGSITLEPLE